MWMYLLLCYAVASCWEHGFHLFVLHARRRSRQRWRQWAWLGDLMRLAYFFHHEIHHRRTFRSSPLVQFDSDQQRRVLSRRLRSMRALPPEHDHFGASLSGYLQVITVAGPPVLLNLMLAAWLAPALAWLGVVVGCLPMLISRYIHPMLHGLPPRGLLSPALARIIQRQGWFLYLRQYHEQHHRSGRCNLNLLLGADWLWSTAASRRKAPLTSNVV
jgi:hypothetical protein